MTIQTAFDGKITSDKSTLNWLSILCDKAAEAFEAQGSKGLAEHARRDGMAIYEALEKAGFYKADVA